MQILGLIDELEAATVGGGHLPGTKKVLMDQEKLLDLVDQLRASLPTEVREAEEVLQKRADIMNAALLEARRVKAAAEDEFKNRVQQNELVSEAQKRADEIVAEAQRKAQRSREEANAEASARRQGADQYAHEVLAKVEKQMAEVLEQVRRGLAVL